MFGVVTISYYFKIRSNTAKSSVVYYLESYYNKGRLHPAINYYIPYVYENLTQTADHKTVPFSRIRSVGRIQ